MYGCDKLHFGDRFWSRLIWFLLTCFNHYFNDGWEYFLVVFHGASRKSMLLQGMLAYSFDRNFRCNDLSTPFDWIKNKYSCSSSSELSKCIAQGRALCNSKIDCKFVSIGWAPLLNQDNSHSSFRSSPLPQNFDGVKIRNLVLTQDSSPSRKLNV